ncbi:MAG: hypothetical protein RL711_433 [Bacteroidota bacterium]|jgi:hypothetical protein
MKPLFIPATAKTPLVNCDFDMGMVELSGMSYSEDTFGFYEPVFLWLNEYVLQPNEETNFNMKIKYFNTSSVKCLFDILEVFTNLSKSGKKVHINWYYDKEDEEMRDTGENFSSILNCDFTLRQN